MEETCRCLVFSGTGNTDYVADQLQRMLLEKGAGCETLHADALWADCGLAPGHEPDVQAVARKLDMFLEDCTMLILAFPTHDSNVPQPMRSLFPLLPQKDECRLVVVSTMYIAGGDCCMIPVQELKDKGYKAVFAGYVKMPNSIRIPRLDYFAVKNGSDLDSYYESSRKTLREIIAAIEQHHRHLQGRGLPARLFGSSQRWTEKRICPSIIKQMFVTSECIQCRQCASICPSGNIDFAKGFPEFGNNCILCLRCYNFCPQEAILVGDESRDRLKFPRYKGFNGWKPPRLRPVRPTRRQ